MAGAARVAGALSQCLTEKSWLAAAVRALLGLGAVITEDDVGVMGTKKLPTEVGSPRVNALCEARGHSSSAFGLYWEAIWVWTCGGTGS